MVIAQLPLLLCALGCSEHAKTYPCILEVYSEQEETIRILDCKGLGVAQPSGIIVTSRDGGPTATYLFPRLKQLPNSFVIIWKKSNSDEEFSQRMQFPAIPKGSDGVIECRLGKDNIWVWTFVPRKYDE